MKPHWITRIFGLVMVVVIFVAGFGTAVHQLWNAFVPVVFGLPALSYWQALGLLCLCTILFGSWRALPSPLAVGRRHDGVDRAVLTSEQERLLRKGLASGCGRESKAQTNQALDAS